MNQELGELTASAGVRESRVSGLALHALVATCLICGLLLFYGFYYSVHQDLAGSALSGRLAVTLGQSFRDYAVYFPPAERAWFSIAARLSDATGTRLDLAVVLMTAAAVLFSTSFAYWIRRQTAGASPLFFIASVSVLVVVPILFKNVFGLREHLIALGLWPYLVLRVSDPDGIRIGRGARLLLGLWMGATLLFKYLYCVVVALVELADAAVQRRPLLLFRVENIASGAVVAVYLFCWLVLDPSQRAVIAGVVSAIDANLVDPRTNTLQALSHLYFAAFFLLALRIFGVPGRRVVLSMALLLGATIAAWMQQRWYSHHLFPIALAYVAWWWMAATSFKWWGHLVMSLYLAVPMGSEYFKTAAYQDAAKELDQTLERSGHEVAGKTVGVLTMHPSPYNQYLASHGGLRWNSSMNNSYVAAELKSFDRPENAHIPPPPVKLDVPGRRMLHDEMLRLWEDMPPDVIILDHSYRWPLRYVNVEWMHVFSKDPRFNAVMKHYRPVLAHKGERLEFKYYERIR